MKRSFLSLLISTFCLSASGSGISVVNGSGLPEFALTQWWVSIPSRVSRCLPASRCQLPAETSDALQALSRAVQAGTLQLLFLGDGDYARAATSARIGIVALDSTKTHLLIAQRGLIDGAGHRVPLVPIEMALVQLSLFATGSPVAGTTVGAQVATALTVPLGQEASLKAHGYDANGLAWENNHLVVVDSGSAIDLSRVRPMVQGCPGGFFTQVAQMNESGLTGGGQQFVWQVDVVGLWVCSPGQAPVPGTLQLRLLFQILNGTFADLLSARPNLVFQWRDFASGFSANARLH